MNKRQNQAVILFFLVFVFGFAIVSVIKPDTGFSEEENRELEQMPKLKLKDVLDGTFSSDYEAYLSDQFPWRNRWISVKTAAERAQGRQEVNDIYFADDDYLIEKHSGVFDTQQAKGNLTYLASFMEAQQAKLGKDHVKALIAPNALYIMEDKLPPFADAGEEKQFFAEIQEALPEGCFVDTVPVLLDHREEYVYYRTDHHWTTLGAWYAYETWANAVGLDYTPREAYRRAVLTTDFYGTVEAKVNWKVPGDTIEAWMPLKELPYTLTYNHDDSQEKHDLYDKDRLQTRDKYAVFFGGNQPLTEIHSENASERKLLMIKDSYAHCFVPFALQDFCMVSMVDMRYFNERLSEYIDANAFTDILFLYNASGFAQDAYLAKLAL